MSFLIENIYRQTPRVSRVVAPRVLTGQAPRAFSTSLVRNRTATETVKEGLKSVDRAVSHKIVDGIEAGVITYSIVSPFGVQLGLTCVEHLTHKIQEGMEGVTAGKMAGKAEEAKGEAKAKASEWEGKAKGAAEHAKGAAEHVEGKVKGAAEHVKGKVKGAAEDAKSKM